MGALVHNNSSFNLIEYLDVDYAGCKIDMKNTSGSFNLLEID